MFIVQDSHVVKTQEWPKHGKLSIPALDFELEAKDTKKQDWWSHVCDRSGNSDIYYIQTEMTMIAEAVSSGLFMVRLHKTSSFYKKLLLLMFTDWYNSALNKLTPW